VLAGLTAINVLVTAIAVGELPEAGRGLST
jgi:hypothetical protein